MIKRLVLRNWRAFDDVAIEFSPGTTFLVAKNGIGKTSLLEAAQWALCGEVVGDSDTAIRLGARKAVVEAEVEMSKGRTLVIRRFLERPRKNVVSRVEAFIDERELSVDELTNVLEDWWEASTLFVSRSAFLTENFRSEKDPDLIEQLSRAFGITDLKRARDELAPVIHELSGTLRDDRKLAKVHTAEIDRVRQELEVALAEEQKSEKLLSDTREELSLVSVAARKAEEAQQIADRANRWDREMSEIAEQARPWTGILAFNELVTSLEDVERRLADSLESLRHTRAVLQGRLQATEENLARLLQVDGPCPICLRSLTLDDRSHAEEGHREELAALREEYERLDDSDLTEELARVRSLIRRALASGSQPPAVEPSDAPAIEAALKHENEARGTLENSLRAHQHARTRREDFQRQLSELEARVESERQLEPRYRELALFETSSETIDSVITQALSEYIHPLSDQIRASWKYLFADRPDLQVDPSGRLTRLVNGETLPFEAFSGGEQMSAKLLLRLVTLTTATAAGFCWIDEPLEHLDPTTRRLTAGMLASAGSATGIRQLVITTFEEELARRIAKFDEGTHLVYIRAHPAE